MLTLLTSPLPSWPSSKRSRHECILYSLALEECAASRTGTASGFDDWICTFRSTEAGQMSVVVYSYDTRRSRRFFSVTRMILSQHPAIQAACFNVSYPRYLTRLHRSRLTKSRSPKSMPLPCPATQCSRNSTPDRASYRTLELMHVAVFSPMSSSSPDA